MNHDRGPLLVASGDDLTLVRAEETEHERVTRLGYDEKTGEVCIDGVIDAELGSWFAAVHRRLTHLGHDNVLVHLNTEGGDCQSMLMFCDTVRASQHPVTVRALGNVCSAGVLMLACADRRLVTRNCVMMIHQHASSGEGDGLRYQESKERRKWEDWLHTRMIELMAEYSGKEVSYWRRILEKRPEHWLLGGHAIVEEGLADEVVPY